MTTVNMYLIKQSMLAKKAVHVFLEQIIFPGLEYELSCLQTVRIYDSISVQYFVFLKLKQMTSSGLHW